MSNPAIEDIYPLSPLQQGMLFHSLYAPDAGQHLLQLTCTLEGELDTACFEACWADVLAAHSALRASFVWEDLEEPLQIVHRAATLPLTRLDWQGLSPEAQEREQRAFLEADRRRGFTLSEAPLMRLMLARTGPRTHTLVWSCHHLLLDGWSLGLVLRDCLASYNARRQGEPAPRRIQRPYRDYIAWLKQQPAEPAERFWRERLRGFSAPTALLVARNLQGTEEQPVRYGRHETVLSAEVSSGLRELARSNALTLNTLFQGAWALLLSRYSGESDVVFGTTVSGRPSHLPGVESMVGMFINTQPVRAQVEPELPLLEWLQRLQRQQVEARQFEYSSLVQIHGWSELPRGQELFDTILVFENFPNTDSAEPPRGGFAIRDLDTHDFTNYTLDIDILPAERITLLASYDRRVLDDATLERLMGHFSRLLGDMVARPEQRLGTLSFLSPEERQQLITGWNQRRVRYPVERSIQELIQEQVARTPDAIAVSHRDARLTYRELSRRANRLAHQLVARGVGADVVVALLGERGVDFLTSIVGVLEAGGAYLPLDPQHPPERLAQILRQSRTPLVVVSPERRELLDKALALLPAGERPRAMDVREMLAHEAPEHPLPPRSGASDLAYVIYTSGSTGVPKGAMLEHSGKINHLCSMIDFMRLGPSDVMAQTASQCFDISVWQFLAPLVVGARVEIFDNDIQREPHRFLAELDRTGATVLEVVPSLLTTLVEELEQREPGRLPLSGLRWLMPTGEVLPPSLCRRWLRLHPSIPLVNAYGPTETSDDTNLHTVTQPPAEGEERVPVGHAIPNLTMYILDGRMEPAPIGLPGELYIGGVGVGRGYLNEPARTAAVYLPDPFSREPGARFYKTGDICRYLPDGNIEFVNRADFQVKIRGYRIEPGEVEAALSRHPAVKQPVVVARELPPRGKQLVAYVVLREDAAFGAQSPEATLRAFLHEQLPSYMVPSAFVVLPRLPLNANGKVDRKALPSPERTEQHPTLAPRDPVEEKLVAIWKDVLSREAIGVDEDFFEVGGHSLLAIRVHSRIREVFQLELPLRSLFELTTVEKLARKIDALRWASQSASGSGEDGGENPGEEREEIEL